MKDSSQTIIAATLALLLGTVIGSFAPFITKVILKELPPFTVLFVRLTIMVVILFPLIFRRIHRLLRYGKELVLLSIFWTANLTLFVTGIQTATSLSAALLYATVPITVLLISIITRLEKLTREKWLGVCLGCLGAFIILFFNNVASEFGSFQGTLLLAFAAVSYSLYLVYSKRLSLNRTPLEITAAASMIGWVISLCIMLVFDGVDGLRRLPDVSLSGWIALGYSGILLGVFMYFLLNWGIGRGTALIAACMQYVGMVMTGLTGFFLLGERLTPFFVLGAVCIITGLYFITIRPALRKRSG